MRFKSHFARAASLIGLATTLFSCSNNAASQSSDHAKSSVKEITDADLFLGTKTPYPFNATDDSTAPAGYKAVFINYIGRHGARFFTDNDDEVALQKVLDEAAAQNALTEKGEELKRKLANFIRVEKGNYGNISILGQEEQKGIATRMINTYPQVFKQRGITVKTTRKKRTLESASAFLAAFDNYPKSRIRITTPSDSLNDAMVFYHISPGYKKYKKSDYVKVRVDSILQSSEYQKAAAGFCKSFFKADFLKDHSGQILIGEKSGMNAMEFTQLVYGIYAISHDIREDARQMGIPADSLSFDSFFTNEELREFSFANGAEDFLEKGPGISDSGIQTRVALPLLVDFLNSTEDYIHDPDSLDAYLRFGHAEAISPFAALMGIKGASETTNSILKYNHVWSSSHIIPMSANIQWILYKNAGDNYLLKVILNEKTASLPIPTDNFPYYKWDEVLSYYQNKLHSFHLKSDDNMHAYLLQLQ